MKKLDGSPNLRLGLIGLGRAATSTLPSIAAHPHIRLAGAAEPRGDARRAFTAEFGGKTYETAVELCADPDVDAVYIATPHQFHAEQAILAAEHGKHALVEKPMALTVDECQAMTCAADRSGTVLIIGPTHGYDPPILTMQEIIRSGDLGRVRMILTFNYTNFLYRPRRPEELDTSLGGGIVFNQLPHQVDIVRLLAGAPVRGVNAVLGTWDPDRGTEGSCMALLEFENGAAATMVYSGYDRFDSDEFHGWVGEGGRRKSSSGHGRTRQALEALGANTNESDLKASTGFGGIRQKRAGSSADGKAASRHQPHFGVTIVSCERADLRVVPDGLVIYGDAGRRELPVAFGRAIPDKGQVLDEFYGAVVEGLPPVHDGRWGQATLEVCLSILASSRTGWRVFGTRARTTQN